jgi:glycosyl transferase family 2
MDGARLTALLPVKHYHPRFLEQSVASMRAQDSDRWRLSIVVEPIDVAHFESALGEALADPRIRLVANSGRKLAGAINSGMRAAETEFVALLLGDDLWAAEAVRVLDASIARHPEVDFFHSSRRIIDADGRAISSATASGPSVTASNRWSGSIIRRTATRSSASTTRRPMRRRASSPTTRRAAGFFTSPSAARRRRGTRASGTHRATSSRSPMPTARPTGRGSAISPPRRSTPRSGSPAE